MSSAAAIGNPVSLHARAARNPVAASAIPSAVGTNDRSNAVKPLGPSDDIILSDIVLGYHPDTGAPAERLSRLLAARVPVGDGGEGAPATTCKPPTKTKAGHA